MTTRQSTSIGNSKHHTKHFKGQTKQLPVAPSKEEHEAICKVLRSGGSMAMAADAAGVQLERLESWLAFGEEVLAGAATEAGPAAEACAWLARDVPKQRALGRAACLEALRKAGVEGEFSQETTTVTQEGAVVKETSVTKHSPPQWKAAQWWLEYVQQQEATTSQKVEGGAPEIRITLDGEGQACHASSDEDQGNLQADGTGEKPDAETPASKAGGKDAS